MSTITPILNKLNSLDKADLEFLQNEIAQLLEYAPEPDPLKAELAPGHHLEEKMCRNKDGSTRTYVVERWYERNGHGYKHKSKSLFVGTMAEFKAKMSE